MSFVAFVGRTEATRLWADQPKISEILNTKVSPVVELTGGIAEHLANSFKGVSMMFQLSIKRKSAKGNFDLKLKFVLPVSLILFILKLLIIH